LRNGERRAKVIRNKLAEEKARGVESHLLVASKGNVCLQRAVASEVAGVVVVDEVARAGVEAEGVDEVADVDAGGVDTRIRRQRTQELFRGKFWQRVSYGAAAVRKLWLS